MLGQPRQHIKKQRHYFANKDPSSQSYGFSSSHVWMWQLNHKESWAPKNWCFWTVVLEKSLESPLDFKEIKPVYLKGNQFWIFTGRTDAEAEAATLWPPDRKSWLIRKDLDAGKDWRWEEKGMTEDEMVGWHHWFNGHEFEQALGDGEGQGSLVSCSLWDCKESDILNDWTTARKSLCELVNQWARKIQTCNRLLKATDISGDFSGGSVVKNLPCNAGNTASVPVEELRFPHTTEQISSHATTAEPLHHNERTHLPQPRPDTTK